MIPPFYDHGYLPPGIHRATLDEVESRFGAPTPERRELMQSLRWLVDMCHQDDILRLVVNGSFVTDKTDPEDVDCVALIGPSFGQHGITRHEWRTPLPFIHLELADAIIFQDYVERIFGTDGRLVAKGVIEVVL
jgi:hypothetical protein